MNYKSVEYIEQYNKNLNEHCNWEIQICTDEEHKDIFVVFHLNTHPSRQACVHWLYPYYNASSVADQLRIILQWLLSFGAERWNKS